MQRAIRLAFLAVPATLALGACGGTTHIGEITPVVSHRIDGTWVYNAKESDDPAKFVPKMQEGRGRRTGRNDRGDLRRSGRPAFYRVFRRARRDR